MDENPLDLPHAVWRLLDTGFGDGATNMAIDEAILLAVAEGRSPPTLRFYGWMPPCVSVGYAQSLGQEVDRDACRGLGYTLVRRLTGGRAVLHVDELTYSVIAPLKEPRVVGDILTSYRRLSIGLVAGLRRLGCHAVQAGRPSTPVPSPVGESPSEGVGTKSPRPSVSAACFDEPSPYEVMALGRKLVGSAQARRKRVVLQHGTLPLQGDVSRLCEVLALPEPERRALRDKLRRRAVTLEEALERSVTYEETAEALAEGFACTLNLTLECASLSAAEQSAMALLRAKYLGDEWLYQK